jgi:ABC-type polysaccharide/polyol phosphate export permease
MSFRGRQGYLSKLFKTKKISKILSKTFDRTFDGGKGDNMNKMVKELISYRSLLWAFIVRNIQVKYKQTAMGFLWAIFMPVVIVLSGIMVKKAMAILSGSYLELSAVITVSVKALPWAFFVSALKFAVGALTQNMNLVGKIYFPRAILPLSYVFGALFDFLISALAFSALFIFAGVGISIHILWLPVMLLLLVIFTSGLALLLACGNLFYRDVKYIVDVILTFGIFFTPVFYEAGMFGKYEPVLLISPVGALLENINTVVVLHQPPDLFWMIYAAVCSVLTFVGGWYIFQKNEPRFAECM